MAACPPVIISDRIVRIWARAYVWQATIGVSDCRHSGQAGEEQVTEMWGREMLTILAPRPTNPVHHRRPQTTSAEGEFEALTINDLLGRLHHIWRGVREPRPVNSNSHVAQIRCLNRTVNRMRFGQPR